jgi:hypothetical protein
MSDLKNEKELNIIVSAIKKANDSRTAEKTISTDQTNEELVSIFHDVQNVSELEFKDSANSLTDTFGYDGYCAIREAEQGCY